MDEARELLVSVDIETSGQSPSVGSLLSIGACVVFDPDSRFYIELRPDASLPWSETAERVHGMTRARLEAEGADPPAAMEKLAQWLAEVAAGANPIFVGFNAPFDWMFVADYFWRFLGRNPFGVSAIDLKSYYMAHVNAACWSETHKHNIYQRMGQQVEQTHNALDDALAQAALARTLLRNAPGNLDES